MGDYRFNVPGVLRLARPPDPRGHDGPPLPAERWMRASDRMNGQSTQ
jgi:hypothetical protein